MGSKLKFKINPKLFSPAEQGRMGRGKKSTGEKL